MSFQKLVSKDAVAPAAIVIQQRQATDGLVEHVEVARIKQQTLGSDQGFTCNFESRRLRRIAGISRPRVFPQSDQHLVLHNVACGSGSKSLIGCTLAGLLSTWLTPEAIAV